MASGIGLDAIIFINDKTIVQKSQICMSLYERIMAMCPTLYTTALGL